MIGARGPNGPFAPATKLNLWFRKVYQDQYKALPVYSSYHMATAFLGAKAAYEKAMKAGGGKTPSDDDIVKAFEYLKFESVAGIVDMSLGKGHQAVQSVPLGTVRIVDGKATLADFEVRQRLRLPRLPSVLRLARLTALPRVTAVAPAATLLLLDVADCWTAAVRQDLRWLQEPRL